MNKIMLYMIRITQETVTSHAMPLTLRQFTPWGTADDYSYADRHYTAINR